MTYEQKGNFIPMKTARFNLTFAELTENRHAGNYRDLGVRLALKLEFLVEDDAFHGF